MHPVGDGELYDDLLTSRDIEGTVVGDFQRIDEGGAARHRGGRRRRAASNADVDAERGGRRFALGVVSRIVVGGGGRYRSADRPRAGGAVQSVGCRYRSCLTGGEGAESAGELRTCRCAVSVAGRGRHQHGVAAGRDASDIADELGVIGGGRQGRVGDIEGCRKNAVGRGIARRYLDTGELHIGLGESGAGQQHGESKSKNVKEMAEGE